MNENYIYPATISKGKKKVSLELIDFKGTLVEAETIESAVEQAQQVLALLIMELLEEGKTLPNPSEVENGIYIHIWLPYYKNIAKEIYVKKTVTIPQWLDLLAKENNINFSSCLVKGIKNELGIDLKK